MRRSIYFFFFILFHLTTAVAGVRDSDGSNSNRSCVRMKVASSDIASFGDQGRQHYRIVFENDCEGVRIVYWCAEHPSKTLTTTSICTRGGTTQTGIAAPLYAVIRQREFQWTFPPGTRIRYVACNESSYPTSDFRCTSADKRR